MTDYVKISVTIEQIDFDYTNLFKKRKHESYFGMEVFYAFLFLTYTSIVEKDTAKIENETDKLKEQLKNRVTEILQPKFKDFELKDINFSESLIRASEQTVEWCIENLTVSQIINMGLNVINIKE